MQRSTRPSKRPSSLAVNAAAVSSMLYYDSFNVLVHSCLASCKDSPWLSVNRIPSGSSSDGSAPSHRMAPRNFANGTTDLRTSSFGLSQRGQMLRTTLLNLRTRTSPPRPTPQRLLSSSFYLAEFPLPASLATGTECSRSWTRQLPTRCDCSTLSLETSSWMPVRHREARHF